MNATLTAPKAKTAFTAESLPDHPLFEGLGNRNRHILAEYAMRATFEPGTRIVETGETLADRLLALYRGEWRESVDPVFGQLAY